MTPAGDLLIKKEPPHTPPLPAAALAVYESLGQRAIPAIARNEELLERIFASVRGAPSQHRLLLGDSRQRLAGLADGSVQLAVTSPPYWTLKRYEEAPGQLGAIADYEEFLKALDEVWAEVFRVLTPGGRLVVVVGDVNIPRRDPNFRRHLVFPLHASIQEHARRLGFDNLAPIIWYKIANARFEAGGGGFYGKPYEPGAIVKNDVEYILFLRKPGGYRSPSPAKRLASIIPAAEHRAWFRQVWTLGGASTRRHPAPFPLELAERLVRMFSFFGDTVLDPFAGSGTVNLAALRWGRNSVGVEVAASYLREAAARLLREPHTLALP
ncbi:DNA-methyltransferase [Oceanithermus sp.]